jgi:futalosine hydrolase
VTIDDPRVLVVAATERELAAPAGWYALCCGVGPVEAASATAAAIAVRRPLAVLHVGIAGARRARAVPPVSFVIGSESRYSDLGVPSTWAPHTVIAAPALIEAAQRVLPAALRLPIGTSGRIGGVPDCDVEAMEGFGVLRAAEAAGIPAIEVRCISNDVEETDRSRWHLDAAFAAIVAATPSLVREIERCLR